MSTLQKPKFKKLSYSSFGGAPLLLSLWNHFDFSLLLTQCGIYKSRGCPTWKLAFLFVIGLISRCTSCLQMIEFYKGEGLLQKMFGNQAVTQSVLSRFVVSAFEWAAFNTKRIAQFQADEETRLLDGDIIALDDTLVEHNHAKKMPFLFRLFDHCSKTYVHAMNVVALHAVKENGLQYPLLYSVWKQDNGVDPHESKLDLALRMLKQVKNQAAESMKCWVAMDSWYLVKDFYLAIEELEFHWVSRAKKNMTLYRKVIVRGKERMIKTLPEKLFDEARPTFKFCKKKSMCMQFKDIYVAVDEIHRGQGYRIEPVLKHVNAVVTAYLEEDQESGDSKETFALLLSDQVDAKPEEIVRVYKKRWSIEMFFRNAKQELGLNDCHSTDENHIHAHISLLFVAESLVRYAQWKYNEKAGTEEEVTHGQVVALLLRTRCEIRPLRDESIQVYFDMPSKRFANFFRRFWPNHLLMSWFVSKQNWQVRPLSG